MANISTLDDNGTVGHQAYSGNTKLPYLIWNTIDLAAAVTAKGSALAQGDTIEAIALPAETLVLSAGFIVTSAMTGTSTDAAIDMGQTGGDVDQFVDGFDLDGASAGDYTAVPAATGPLVVSAADTLDLLIATQTNTITGGTLKCWALVVDIDEQVAPGIATRT